MAETLLPCPLCGSMDLKHYVTNARERNRGVIVCKGCGLRLEAYSDDEYKVAQAYQGDFKSAHEFTWEQARKAVADRWNRRAVRTCRPVVADDGAGAWGVYCSECSYRFAGPHGKREVSEHMAARRDIMPRYCPNCGARVVSER